MHMKKFVVSLCLVMFGFTAMAQLSIAPTAVYLDQNGVGTLHVSNNSSSPQEITINFQFGYSDQDAEGVLIMQYGDTAAARLWGLDPMLKAFPKTFILPPNQQQIVRLQARPRKDLMPGTYFTRIKVGSAAQAADVGTQESDGIATRVNFRFEQVIVAFYKHGKVNTGINLERVETKADTSYLTLDAYYKNTGNSPYLGRVHLQLKGADGKVVSEFSQTVAMYFSGKRRYRFVIPKDMKPGRYDVEFKFETIRNDISSEDLVQAQPYTYKTSVNIR